MSNIRLILQYYYGFLQKKTERLEIDPQSDTDTLIMMITQRVGRSFAELLIRCKRDQYMLKIIHGWPLSFYELQSGQTILVEIRETEAELKQKESQRLNQRYLNKLGFQSNAIQKLSQVSETSENSSEASEEEKGKRSAIEKTDIEDQVFQVVKSGKLAHLKNMFIKADQLNTATFGGWNPIHFAIFLEHVDIVEYLVSQNVDINKVTDDGWTPLQIAVHKHNLDIVRLLLKQNSIDVNQITDAGIAVNLACKTNQLQVLQLLIEKKADLRLKDKSDRNAFDYSNSETKKLLMNRSSSIQEQKQTSIFTIQKPPITKGILYKVGFTIVTLNERFFYLNPDEGSFIRYRTESDYPLRPMEIVPLKSIKQVQMASKSIMQKAGYIYFDVFYPSRMELACKHHSTAVAWIRNIHQAVAYWNQEEIRASKDEGYENDTKNVEVVIEDVPEVDPRLSQSPKSTNVPKREISPEQSLNLPKIEPIAPQRQSAPTQQHIEKEDPMETLVKDSKVNFQSFEIIKELGAGAFGKVMLVKKKDDQKTYAMKALKKRTLIVKKQLRYAVTEANVLKTCKHPFILGLHYAFQTPNNLYLVLDYCNGGDLSYYIADKGTFTENDTKFYIAELLLAIDYLHSKDIIYRDMKPENILIQNNGHIKLADFGLSKDNFADQDKTKTFCGSPAYLAPDMLQQKGAGKPIDIYGIGAVMFEMLNGQPPYFDEDIPTMYKQIQAGTLKFTNKKISNDAKALIQRMLERDPLKRITASQIKQDPFFKNIDWDQVYNCAYPPPITDFSCLQEDEDFEAYGDDGGYNNGEAIFQDQDYDEQNEKVNRVIKFSFAT